MATGDCQCACAKEETCAVRAERISDAARQVSQAVLPQDRIPKGGSCELQGGKRRQCAEYYDCCAQVLIGSSDKTSHMCHMPGDKVFGGKAYESGVI